MDVVQIVTQLEAGGAQRVALLLNGALRERGHDSQVWFLYKKRSAFSEMLDLRIIYKQRPVGMKLLICMFLLARGLLSQRPQVLITHTHYANVVGQLTAWLCGVQIRIAVQHSPVSANPRIARVFDQVFGSIGVYTAIVAVSETVVRSMSSYPASYQRRLSTIYNGVPPPPLLGILNSRKRFGLTLSVPLILHVGRLAYPKNQAILLESLAALSKGTLALIGDGEDSEKLKRRALELGVDSRVHFLGELSPVDVWGLLLEGDIFVFPSLSEAMPIALLEAMAAHLPIIAADIPAIREVVGEAGILVPPSNSEALIEAIRATLSSRERAADLGRRASVRASTFDFNRTVEGYERLFCFTPSDRKA